MTFNVRSVPVNLRNTHIIPFSFQYFEPKNLNEALRLLKELGSEAKILAGGTDLLVKMKMRLVEPKYLINIKRISDLRYVIAEGPSLRIGALTTWRDLERSELIKEEVPALYDAVKTMGGVQVRNMATIGGNLCNASPAADSAPPLLVHEAKARLTSLEGFREVSLEEFFTGPGGTVMRPDELLQEVVIPRRRSKGSSFIKISRVSMDLAIASASTYVEVDGDFITNVRVALGSVAPRPIRTRRCEAALTGRRIDESTLREVAEIVASEISPIDDVRSTAWFRREVSKTLVFDSLMKSLSRAR
ncbi:MAG: xanthine dehydrogenase family protein subunit M [Zestosphaera sp.]